MTNEQKLSEAYRLVEEAWGVLIPDKPPRTVAEDEYFDAVNETASRLLSDIEQMMTYATDAEL